MRASPAIHNPHLQGESFYWQGNSTGVLLIHGFTATTAEVRLLAEILHDEGYTVSAPLLPGHYSTPADLNQVKWQDWVACVEKAYQALAAGCARVFIGGESLGGLLTLYLASQHPEASGALVYAPALKLTASRLDILRLYAVSPFIPYVPKGDMDADTQWQGYPVNPLKGAVQLLRLQRQVRNLLPRIRQPLLIVQGRLDATVHPAVPGMIASGVSSDDIVIRWMTASSHVVILDKELDRAAEITLDFIQRILSENPLA